MKNRLAKAIFSPGYDLLPAEKGIYSGCGLLINLSFSSKNLSGLKTSGSFQVSLSCIAVVTKNITVVSFLIKCPPSSTSTVAL